MLALSDFVTAQQNIAGQIHRTPIITSATLNRICDVHLYFKAELFQKTGSFKVRGALNKLHCLTKDEKKRGVITISSGNHAQGVAYAAAIFGIPATIVMPRTAPSSKIDATKGYGAEVIVTEGDLMSACTEVLKERKLTMIHPFDDPCIIAGQGTMGLEILEDLPDVDAVLVPVGGGGLISGVATSMKLKNPTVRVIGVEPVSAPNMMRSVQEQRVIHLPRSNTVADGLTPGFVGELNLRLVERYVHDLVLVSDSEIMEALWLLLQRAKLVTEPSGAASFAALFSNKVNICSKSKVVCVLSGGNIAKNHLSRFLCSGT